MKIGNAIKICRTQKGINQLTLAKLAGISKSYLSLLEKDKRDPNIKTLKKISDAMNVPISILIFLATDKEEINNISTELVEKLSYTTLKLISE